MERDIKEIMEIYATLTDAEKAEVWKYVDALIAIKHLKAEKEG